MLQKQNVKKILDAIKNQRWFFFKNKPKIIFDRDTGLIWANLDYFNYGKRSGYNAGDLINSTNREGIDGFNRWITPSGAELWKLVEDKTFPCCEGDNWRIKNSNLWLVNYSNSSYADFINLDYESLTIEKRRSGCVIPCSNEIQPQNYDGKNLEMVLKIFIENKLEPIFNDAEIIELYQKIIFDRITLMKKLSEIRKQVNLKNFSVDKYSSLNYSRAIQNLTEYLIDKLDEYTFEGAEILNELKKISSPNELVPDVEKVRADIENLQEDATHLEKTLLSMNRLESLADLNPANYPPIEFVAECLKEKLNQVFDKVEFFDRQEDFVRSACDALNLKFDFEGEYLKQFLIKDRAAQKFIVKLIRYVKAGNFQQRQDFFSPTVAEIVLEHLQSYRYGLADWGTA